MLLLNYWAKYRFICISRLGLRLFCALLLFSAVLLAFSVDVEVVCAELSGIAQISRNGHTCALSDVGGVRCWGANAAGQIGDGSTVLRSSPVDVVGLTSGVIAVAAGNGHTCALTSAMGVKCWGDNYYGQIGDGTNTDRLTPTDVFGLTSGVRAVFAGVRMSCAITTSNSAKCWGMNDWGELGDGTATRRNRPVDVVGLAANVSTMAVGYRHACAVLSSGALKCWGNNAYGEVGDGTLLQRRTPVDVVGLGSGVGDVAVGLTHSCAASLLGAVSCWGTNSSGQLGDGTNADRGTPVAVVGLSSNVVGVAIRSGGNTSCALLDDGSAKCWGDNGRGDVGDGTKVDKSAPVQVLGLLNKVISLSQGCVVLDDSSVRCWGNNGTGSLGNGATMDRFVAKEIEGFSGAGSLVAAGQYSSCGATDAGALSCWGNNGNGQLGDGSFVSRFVPAGSVGISAAVSISGGQAHSCAVELGGAVKCWGYGSGCVLGSGAAADSPIPVGIAGLSTGGQKVSAGWLHNCVLTDSGGVWCWGNNGSGRLGDGTTTTRCNPVSPVGLNSGIADIAVGVAHGCALASTGEIRCWGGNSDGQLGDGSNADRLSPVVVSVLPSPMASVAVGYYHSCALSVGGGVSCWGNNGSGRLGDGTTTSSNVPVSVSGLGSGVNVIAAGGYHSCAALTTGGIKCWGDNSYGQLGDGTAIDRLGPVDVQGASGVFTQLSLGRYHSCALSADRKIFCWGYNSHGQITDLAQADTLPFKVLREMKIRGHVTYGGNVLVGVALGATDFGLLYPNQETASDSSGAYEFSVAESLSYRVTPALDGYHFLPVDASGVMTSDVTHDFVADINRYSISGVVKANGVLLEGAIVDGGGLGTQMTDSSGYYSFTNVPHGTAFSIAVSHVGAIINSNTASGTLTSDLTVDFVGTLETYKISGTVTLEGLINYAGVVVGGGTLGNHVTGSNGYYEFLGVNYLTHYSLQPSLFGYNFVPGARAGTVTSDLQIDFIGTLSDSDGDGIHDLDEIKAGTNYNKADSDDDGVTDGQEIIDGSNPLDRGSNIPVIDIPTCVEWNGFLGMSNIMEHVNNSSGKLEVQSKLFTIEGRLEADSIFGIRGGSQYDLLTSDLSGFGADSYGQVCSGLEKGNRGDLDGRMVLYKPTGDGESFEFAYAVPFQNGVTGKQFVQFNTYQPSLNEVDSNNYVANWIQITNMESSQEKGMLVFYDMVGKELNRHNVRLAGHARGDFSAHEYGQSRVGYVEWIPRKPTTKFLFRNVRYYYDNPEFRRNSFDGAYQVDGVVASGALLAVPLDGASSSAVLEISNILDSLQKIEVSIYGLHGQELLRTRVKLAAHSSYHLIADAYLQGGEGIATIQGQGVESVLAVAMQYRRTKNGSIQSLYGVPAKEALGTTLRGSYNTFLGQDCSLLLINPTAAVAKVSLGIRRYNGTTHMTPETISVGAHSLVDYPLCQREVADIYGTVTVQVEPSNSIVSHVLRIGKNNSYRFGTHVRQ